MIKRTLAQIDNDIRDNKFEYYNLLDERHAIIYEIYGKLDTSTSRPEYSVELGAIPEELSRLKNLRTKYMFDRGASGIIENLISSLSERWSDWEEHRKVQEASAKLTKAVFDGTIADMVRNEDHEGLKRFSDTLYED